MTPAVLRITRVGWVLVAILQLNSAPEVAPDNTETAEIFKKTRRSSYKFRGLNNDLVIKDIALALYY